MAKYIKIKTYVFSIVVFFAVIASFTYFQHKSIFSYFKTRFYKSIWAKQPVVEKEHWMNVFVHGSFGSLLGLLNTYKVISDDVDGTLYKKVVKKMRKDPFFFRNQILLERGLKPISPTFDIGYTNNQKLAAYPIIKAYNVVTDVVKRGRENNHFYTFGWSGLLSQKRRRKESVRLYNSLSEEIEKFKKSGIIPKVRLLSHSHGGNLSLTLAAIRDVLNSKSFNSDKTDNQASEIFNIIKNLATKENLLLKKNQKRFDYVPDNKSLFVDELILLGTPIQVETECLCTSKMFGKVYSFYSDDDVIQSLDCISTKDHSSGQRISNSFVKCGRIKQVRIMYEKDILNARSSQNSNKKSFLGKLFSRENLFPIKSKDPTHKEFWFLSWRGDKFQDPAYVSPLPTVVFTSAILSALESQPVLKDVDINVSKVGDDLQFCIMNHQGKERVGQYLLPAKIVADIKEKVRVWNPADSSDEIELNTVYNHLKHLL
jgi:hypothetical protein